LPADILSQLFQALVDAWRFIVHLAPYMLGGILVAALINTFLPRDKPAKLLRRRAWWMLPASALAGLVSPACTFGTVPIFLEMIRRGAPMGPAAAFLVASALVNPQMFLLTAGALGLTVALIQAAGSLLFAISVGGVVNVAQRHGGDLEGSELTAARKSDMDRHHHKHAKDTSWSRRLLGNTVDLAEFVGFYFVIGTIIAALIAEFVPNGFVVAMLGKGRWWAVPFAVFVSVPTYVCGGGTIPLLAYAQQMGMSTGAALAFLIAGPATRITALSALAVLFRKRLVVVYVVLLIVFACILGYVIGPLVASTPTRVIY